MKVPAKKDRTSNRGGEVDFDKYDWAVEPTEGWGEAVVLMAEEKQSKAGNDMLELTLGLEPQGADVVGGRLMTWAVPTNTIGFDEFLTALCPEQADNPDEFNLPSRVSKSGKTMVPMLVGRRCGVLVEHDPGYQRRDGRKSFKAAKLVPLSEVESDDVF